MSRLGKLSHRLHRGELSLDVVGKRRRYYAVSLLIVVVAVVGLAVNGLNKGIDFSGGASFTTPKTSISIAQAESKTKALLTGDHDVVAQKLGTGGMRIQVSGIDNTTANNVRGDLAKDLGVSADSISPQVVGPSWGQEVTQKAELGLVIFMVLVVIYLAIAFEWRMAMAALIALVHDLVITIGVYALVGFEVTPGTVIGLLTILGYSLYDTVVVFDGLKETTRGITGQTRFTYTELANRSLNMTLVRSINTSVVALLPVAALLFVGGGLLGAGMLNDIALALFVGLAAGAYSSIFIATPLVATLKEATPEMKALAKRVRTKRARAERDGIDLDAEEPQDAAEQDDEDEPAEAAAGTLGGQRRQPSSRDRGRGRPSGKRR
ncbi:protein translocase subunit SecF [Streptomyces sp. SL13]|jgi:preprotein translocase subunit SecF|uniref:Protein-export membrane protein SecF n=1 Tax=Streptantibioticus silvisoli TaxID=2705255 RepID=A0AA90H725_9ACTN|nr:protein translocase subunit SecF [Streptantibioticus silvisoli]MDI5972145.1 protein translocase subunit SecF [Streptantibioticus silvisoli]